MTTEQAEIFCLKYELKTLSDLFVRQSAERWVPGLLWPIVEEEHLNRYKLAAKYTQGKDVMDVACGSGYGSYIIASEGKAKTVWAADIDADAVTYGNIRFPHPNISRNNANIYDVSFDGRFDVVVSFETIEHLEHYNTFLQKVHDSLKPGGLFIVSTPVSPETTTRPHNPHHVIEWGFNDFHTLLLTKFSIAKVFAQSVVRDQGLWARRLRKLIGRERMESVDPALTEYHSFPPHCRGYQLVICERP